MDKFIKVFPNAFSKEYCESVMRKMDTAFANGFGQSRRESSSGQIGKMAQDDMQLHAPDQLIADFIFNGDENMIFNETFWGTGYRAYADEFEILKEQPHHMIYGNKLQKIGVGQGFHAWHCEMGPKEFSGRILAYIVYLNDIEDGGETEFLYQHLRVKPEQGTMVIFPAGFTHTHRGNPPLTEDKYIMTGWVEF